jgi:hypothetical protein
MFQSLKEEIQIIKQWALQRHFRLFRTLLLVLFIAKFDVIKPWYLLILSIYPRRIRCFLLDSTASITYFTKSVTLFPETLQGSTAPGHDLVAFLVHALAEKTLLSGVQHVPKNNGKWMLHISLEKWWFIIFYKWLMICYYINGHYVTWWY